MKRIPFLSFSLFLFLVLFQSFSASSQNFEGKVVYRNSYKSKLPNVSDDQFNAMMGTAQDYFIKGGDYRAETNGTLMQWQLYVNKENRLYNKLSSDETVLWMDGAVNPDEVIKAEIRKDAAVILGYTCDELTLSCKSGVQKYYYSSRLPVDAKIYQQHKAGNWAEFLSRAGAIPLKIVLENPQFTLESEAVEVKPMVLEASLFTLPAGVKTAKSPY